MFLLDRLLVRSFFKSYAICLISLLTPTPIQVRTCCPHTRHLGPSAHVLPHRNPMLHKPRRQRPGKGRINAINPAPGSPKRCGAGPAV